MKNTLSIVFWGILLSVVSAFSLDIRDQTCPDGGVCLSVDGNVCCNGGPVGGCMFSTGVCCENGYFCYEGQFCSTTSQAADDSSGLDTNCCEDAACNSVIGLAPYIIPYNQQPFYGGASGSESGSGVVMTSTGSMAAPTGTAAMNTGSTSTGPTTSPKGTPATTTPSASAANPSASKTSGADRVMKVDTLECLFLLLGLGSLMLVL
ncbi:hypothetical protein NA56DRAFT_699480 [Hyaloscypha hepaticicola]|uniref:Carbohydrate-binding module family 18 protein n=1 Tax=Hyaloscypha hepaticicola TaxID=2082293 RepID=A0A2J6QH03_9HELO|nr:hypothetical protein NA56DRAFT_699480 [Hyaloscypha hepaticicola]